MELSQSTELFSLENRLRSMLSEMITPILKQSAEQEQIVLKLAHRCKKNKEKISSIDQNLDKTILKMVPLETYNKKLLESNSEIKALDNIMNKKLEILQSSLNNLTNKYEYSKSMIKSLEDTQKYDKEISAMREKSFGDLKENLMIDLGKIEALIKKNSYENFSTLESIQGKIEKISYACSELNEKSVHNLHFFMKQSNDFNNKLEAKVAEISRDRISQKDMLDLKKKIDLEILVTKAKCASEIKEINTFIDKVLNFQISSQVFQGLGDSVEGNQLKKPLLKVEEHFKSASKLIEESKDPKSENYQLPAMSLSQLIYQKNSFESLIKTFTEKITYSETVHAKKIQVMEPLKIDPIKKLKIPDALTQQLKSFDYQNPTNNSPIKQLSVPKGIEKVKITSSDKNKPILQYEREKSGTVKEIGFEISKSKDNSHHKFIDRVEEEQEKYFPIKEATIKKEVRQKEKKNVADRNKGKDRDNYEKANEPVLVVQKKQSNSGIPIEKISEKVKKPTKETRALNPEEFSTPVPKRDDSFSSSTPLKLAMISSITPDVQQTPFFTNHSESMSDKQDSPNSSPKSSSKSSSDHSQLFSPTSSNPIQNSFRLMNPELPLSPLLLYPPQSSHLQSNPQRFSEYSSNLALPQHFHSSNSSLASSIHAKEHQSSKQNPVQKPNYDFSEALADANKSISEASLNFQAFISSQTQEMSLNMSVFVQAEIEKLQKARDDSIIAVFESTKQMREKLSQDQEELRIHLKLIHDENKLLIKQRGNDITRIESEFKKLNLIIESHDRDIASSKEDINNLNSSVEGVSESEKIMCCLLKQDEEDRELIQLSAISESKSFIKPKMTISLKPECLSCTGQSSSVYSAFKLACLNYTPSDVIFNQKLYPRKVLIQILEDYLKNLKQFPQFINSINYSVTSVSHNDLNKKNKSKTPKISSRFLLNNTMAVSKIFSDKDISPPPLRRQ